MDNKQTTPINLVGLDIEAFTKELGSERPVPGGGGAGGVCGALAASLGMMVAHLTEGKKKYEAYQDDIHLILEVCGTVRLEMLNLIEADAEGFLPLARAYRMKNNTEEEKALRAQAIEEGSRSASVVPLRMIKASSRLVPMLEELMEKGSKLAVSDVAVAAKCLDAALFTGYVNILINAAPYRGKIWADELLSQARERTEKSEERLERLYQEIIRRLS